MMSLVMSPSSSTSYDFESQSSSSLCSGSEDSYPDYTDSSSSLSSSETDSDIESSTSDLETASEDNSSQRNNVQANYGASTSTQLGLPVEFSFPLYGGADLSVLDSYILLLQYSLRHSLTKKAFSELIDLVTVHLPPTSKSADSLHNLVGVFTKLFEDVQPVPCWYCSKCHRSLDSASTNCPSGCSETSDQFIHVPVGPQLKRKIEG